MAGLGSFYGAYIFDRINRIYRIEISCGISSSLEFKRVGEKVRFAQGIPYQRSDFEAFYSEYAASSYMKRGVFGPDKEKIVNR